MTKRIYIQEWLETGCCREWLGYRDQKDYGRSGGQARTHVLAYERVFGPVPAGMMVCHHCDNPTCGRIDHLYLGTAADNARDASIRGRLARKLTHEQVLSIRADARSNRMIAADYGVSHALIGNIKRGEVWKHHQVTSS